MRTMKSKATRAAEAKAAYTAQLDAAARNLNALQAILASHSHRNAEDPTYGAAGDLAHMNELLGQLIDTFELDAKCAGVTATMPSVWGK